MKQFAVLTACALFFCFLLTACTGTGAGGKTLAGSEAFPLMSSSRPQTAVTEMEKLGLDIEKFTTVGWETEPGILFGHKHALTKEEQQQFIADLVLSEWRVKPDEGPMEYDIGTLLVARDDNGNLLSVHPIADKYSYISIKMAGQENEAFYLVPSEAVDKLKAFRDVLEQNEGPADMAGREIIPVSPTPDAGLYEKICRCLFPYLITQKNKGYTLFSDAAFSDEDYRTFLDAMILQEHMQDAVKTQSEDDGQTISYFSRDAYEQWYADAYQDAPPVDEAALSPVLVDGQECIPIPVLGMEGGYVETSYKIENATSEDGKIYEIELLVTSASLPQGRTLKFTIKIEGDCFTYLRVD